MEIRETITLPHKRKLCNKKLIQNYMIILSVNNNNNDNNNNNNQLLA